MNKNEVKIKRLGEKESAESNDLETRSIKVTVTRKSLGVEDLPDVMRKKFFIKKAQVVKARFCYLPCYRVELAFFVSYFSEKRSDNGHLVFIVDPKRGCGVIEDNIRLDISKKAIDESLMMDDELTEEQAEKKAIVDARWKVLMARYKKPAELKTVKIEKFYRPYYEVLASYGGAEKVQWVAADDYANYFVYN